MGMMTSTAGRSHGRRRRRSSLSNVNSDINVIPFMDVMLVLLIVFMVAAPLLTAGVQVDLPNSKAKAIEQPDNKPIELTVNGEGQLFIGESEIQRDNLIPVLSSMLDGNEDSRIYIRADKGLPYGEVSKIIGMISAAGFTKVALVSEPEK